MADRSGTKPVATPTWLDRLAALGWRFLVVVAALVVLGMLLVRLRLVVIPVAIALFLTVLLAPPVEALRRRRWPSGIATWVVLLGAAVVVSGLTWLIGTRVADQVDELSSAFGQGLDRVDAWLRSGPMGLPGQDLQSLLDKAGEQARERAGQILGGLLSGAMLAVEVVAGLLLTLVIAFFFLKDGPRITGWFLGHVPRGRRDIAEALGRRSWSTMAGYIRGQAVVAAVDAVGIGIGLFFIGVPAALALAVLTFFLAFFPIVGAVVAGLVAALVALASGGVVDALLVVGVVIVVNQLEGNILQPIVMGRALRLHPVVILLALTAGILVAGIFGAFIAVPLAAVVTQAVAEIRERSPASSG